MVGVEYVVIPIKVQETTRQAESKILNFMYLYVFISRLRFKIYKGVFYSPILSYTCHVLKLSNAIVQ